MDERFGYISAFPFVVKMEYAPFGGDSRIRCFMKLRPYQQIMVDYLQNRPAYALFWEMRTGKSPTILSHARNLYKSGRAKKFMILAPPSAIPGWLDHIVAWFPEMIIYCYQGNKEVFDVWNRQEEGIYLCSDAITTKNSVKRPGHRIRARDVKGVDCLIVDESHRIKNPKAGRTQFALQLSKEVEYKYCLTGTPIGGSEIDYYTQFKFLDPSIFHNFNLTEFRRGYFQKAFDPFSPQGDFDEDCREEFESRLKLGSSSLRLSDVREFLPEDIEVPVPLEQTEEQKKMVEDLRRNFLLEYKGKEITAVNAGAELAKIYQILNGHCKTSEGDVVNLNSNPKANWLRCNIRRICKDDKVVIWAHFKQDYENIKKTLDSIGVRYIHYKSGMSPGQREKRINAFNRDEKARVIVAHADSAGMGVDFSIAPTMIFYSGNDNWLSHSQASSRNKTIDTEKTITYKLYLEGTLDEKRIKRQNNKGERVARNMASLIFKEFLNGGARKKAA